MKKILTIIALALPLLVMAQEEKDTTVVVPQTESMLRMAAELSKYGYANKDALSLIQAARISKQAGFVLHDRAKESQDGQDSDSEAKTKAGKISLAPTQLLADARIMAGGNSALLALIEEAEALKGESQVRGAVGGSQYARSSVNARGTDVYNIRFRGGELAVVTVIGDGDTDLDLYIYDSNGNLIERDDDYTDNCVCTWTPRWTGNFKIKIKNRGSVYNSYILRTN